MDEADEDSKALMQSKIGELEKEMAGIKSPLTSE